MTEQNPRTEAELTELIASIDLPAPPELHARVQAMIEQASTRRRKPAGHQPRLRLGMGIASLAALVLALLLAVGGTGSTKLGVEQAAALALAQPTMPAPAESPRSHTALAASVEGIAFPYWRDRFGWRSSGSRLDRRDGRTIRTVFYSDRAGRQVGYAIVAGSPPSAGQGTVHMLHGTPYHLARVDGAVVVSWVRDGHLCVVSGRSVAPATLLTLASWQ
jgi:hypothetical protein